MSEDYQIKPYDPDPLLYTPPAAMRETPRYTLDEARRLVLTELCAEAGGHDLETTRVNTAGGVGVLLLVRCARCHATFTEDTTELPQKPCTATSPYKGRFSNSIDQGSWDVVVPCTRDYGHTGHHRWQTTVINMPSLEWD